VNKTYPYAAWVLKPSFKPAQVTITEPYRAFSNSNLWEIAEGGRAYAHSELYPTKEAAIAAGWERVHATEAKVAKMQDGIDKKRAALAKAAGDAA
jgi:hypothetical protein